MSLPLPIELFDIIAGYLRNNDLMKLRCVNKSLNQVALNKMFYQVNLYGSYEDITFKVQRISEMVDRYHCQGIKQLAIASTEFQHYGQTQFLNSIFYALMGMKLHKLMLMHPNIITKDQLQLLLLTHPLRELECHPLELDEEITWILLKYGHSLTNLSLKLSDIPFYQIIPKLSSTLQNLQSVDLHAGSLKVFEINKLLSQFKIKSLNLNQIKITGKLKCMQHQLDLLRIDDCDVDSADLFSLFNPRKLVLRKTNLSLCNFGKMTNLQVVSAHETRIHENQCNDLVNLGVYKIRLGHVTLPFGGLSLLLKNKKLQYFEVDYLHCRDYVGAQILNDLPNLTYFRVGHTSPPMYSVVDVKQFYDLKTTIVLSSKAFVEDSQELQEWCKHQDLPQHVLIS